MKSWKTELGNFLFRWRSFTQLPWIILVILFLKPFCPNFILDFEPYVSISGIILAFLGEILRFWTHLCAKEGTSGRESFMKADSLNKEGPYAIVRNPLYLGNFLIVGGLLIVFSNILAFAIGISFLIFQYYFIVTAEESYLENKFQDEWRDYKKDVPRFLPNLKNISKIGSNRKKSLLKVLIKESDTIFNFLTMLLIILLLKISYAYGLNMKTLYFTTILYLPFVLFYILLKTKIIKFDEENKNIY